MFGNKWALRVQGNRRQVCQSNGYALGTEGTDARKPSKQEEQQAGMQDKGQKLVLQCQLLLRDALQAPHAAACLQDKEPRKECRRA